MCAAPAAAQARVAANPALIEGLRQLLGDRLSTAASVREQHGRDESWHQGYPPDAVAFARTTEEVKSIVELCARHKTPMIPFGTGTSLEGHVAALKGGVCIDVSQMNNILRVSADDLDVTVEAGVTRKQLNEHIRDQGLFFPIDPGANASLGGMAATRASGTNAVRYGTMRENVLSLTAVLADGRVIRTSRRARKSASGYDLTRLFVGSEGTLGIITEVTLKLYGIPEAMSAAVCSFPDIGAATRTVIQTIQLGVPIARVELLNASQMDAINRHAKLDYPVGPTLFFEFHGSTSYVAEQAETVQSIVNENGGGNFNWATRPEDRAKLWQARHDAYYSCKTMNPGLLGWATDVCVPISRLAECVVETEEDLKKCRLPTYLVGHVGDGNFHITFMLDPKSQADIDVATEFNDRMVLRALAMDGTCTGEHGVGYGKIGFLQAEHGEAMSVMRQIKQTLDPHNLMNPGKIVSL